MKRVFFIFLVLLVSCNSKVPELSILSPLDGSVFEFGDDVVFSYEISNFSGFVKFKKDKESFKVVNETKFLFSDLPIGDYFFVVGLFEKGDKSLNIFKNVSFSVVEKSKPVLDVVRPLKEVENFDIVLEFKVENIKGDSFMVEIDRSNPFFVNSSKYVIPSLSIGSHELSVELFDKGLSTGLKKTVFFDVFEKKSVSGSSFKIRFPPEGYRVKGDLIAVSLDFDKFKLGIVGSENRPNEGHFHFFVDNEDSFLEVDKATFTIKSLSKGSHFLVVEMVNNDHSSLGVKQRVNFVAQSITSKND